MALYRTIDVHLLVFTVPLGVISGSACSCGITSFLYSDTYWFSGKARFVSSHSGEGDISDP
jgi:hypothetical protein